MDEKYIQVRLSRELHEKLVAAGKRFARYAACNPDRARPYLLSGKVSIGDVITELLVRLDGHAARGKAARRKPR